MTTSKIKPTHELCAMIAAEGGCISNPHWHGWDRRRSARGSAILHDLIRFYGSDIGWWLTSKGWEAAYATRATFSGTGLGHVPGLMPVDGGAA